MSVGGAVHPHGVYSLRCHGDESSPLHGVYRVSGDTIHPHRLYMLRGGRLLAAPTDTPVGGSVQPNRLYSERGGRQVAAPTGVVPIIPTGYNCSVPGTAHRAFPTVLLTRPVFYNRRGLKTSVF